MPAAITQKSYYAAVCEEDPFMNELFISSQHFMWSLTAIEAGVFQHVNRFYSDAVNCNMTFSAVL
jgi:hypothetical protein